MAYLHFFESMGRQDKFFAPIFGLLYRIKPRYPLEGRLCKVKSHKIGKNAEVPACRQAGLRGGFER
jgi:hypothetical protein